MDIHGELTSEESRQARAYLRRIVGVLLCGAILAATVLWATKAFAGPVYQAAGGDGVRVLLHDEPCAMNQVSNLPRRATWIEGGKTFEGCWGFRPNEGVVLAFFSDKTVVAIPLRAFVKVQGA